jgi:hypothetical protein
MAIIVVPAYWPRKTLSDKIVEVLHFVPPRGPGPEWDQRPTWWCRFSTAWCLTRGYARSAAFLCPMKSSMRC